MPGLSHQDIFAISASPAGRGPTDPDRLLEIGIDTTSRPALEQGHRTGLGHVITGGLGMEFRFDAALRLIDRLHFDFFGFLDEPSNSPHFAAVAWVVDEFYSFAPNSPALVWAHATCWTQRSLAAAFFGHQSNEDLVGVSKVTDPHLRLGFAHSPHGRAEVRLHPHGPDQRAPRLRWVGARRRPRLERVTLTRQQARPDGRTFQREFSESIGPGAEDHLPGLAHFVGLPGIVDSRLSGVQRLSSGLFVPAPHGRPLLPAAQLADNVGLVDVLLLKLQRLRRISPGDPIMADELTLAFERGSADLVYARAGRTRWDVAPNKPFPEKYEGQWLERQLRRRR